MRRDTSNYQKSYLKQNEGRQILLTLQFWNSAGFIYGWI